MIQNQIALILAVVAVFSITVSSLVIDEDAHNTMIEMMNSDMNTESQNNYPDESELDNELMLYSLFFVILIYIGITAIFVAIRFLVKRYLRRHVRISLLDDDIENNRVSIRQRTTTEDMQTRWPSVLDNIDEVRDRLERLSPEEQFYYKQGEEFVKLNSPLIIPHNLGDAQEIVDPIINDQSRQFIEEEGANAWEFQPDPNLPNDTVLIQNKTEITFLNYNYDASVSTNLPIPCINRVYYCEFKIYELNTGFTEGINCLNSDEQISFGLSTSPYPYFRLPGRHHHSIAYDSTGGRRFNDSFELEPELASLFPRCEKGDVIGIGYRSNSGTVFFTRNGKKLNEKLVGGHIKGWKFRYLYPIVGANIPCKIHVNFGSYGFVFIEANVKKWGYAKANGLKLPPPSYEEYGNDTLLKSGEEDDGDFSDNESMASATDNMLVDEEGHLMPPPPGFEFSTSPGSKSVNEEITLDSYPLEPPHYSEDEMRSKRRYKVPLIELSLSNEMTSPLESNAEEENNEDDSDDERDYENDMDEYEIPGLTQQNTLNNQFVN